MPNQITFTPESSQMEKDNNRVIKPEKYGKITNNIGTGENAKNSFVYLVLKWSFIVGTIITILIIVNNWIFRSNEKVPDFIGDLKTIWEIVTPLITLALGYAFGRSKE